ncbi:MAG TPA: alkylmercury lyase family protein [Geothrix sp.]|nr:alkylmercury lyase family protein [Geothrix sp.]
MTQPFPAHPLNLSTLHQAILEHLVDQGTAPTLGTLASRFATCEETVARKLLDLQAEHGVVLHPGTTDIWVAHPFSTAPTLFSIEGGHGHRWSNCAWCSLGAAALLGGDVRITTTLGGESQRVVLEVSRGELQRDDLFVHFPVPMRRAWDNVIYTCSVMLLFESVPAVDAWCRRHGIPRGDVQPIHTVWEFAKAWYGNHLKADWTKWTAEEARALFRQFGLRGDTWELPGGGTRF